MLWSSDMNTVGWVAVYMALLLFAYWVTTIITK
jgi:hypothetical protein